MTEEAEASPAKPDRPAVGRPVDVCDLLTLAGIALLAIGLWWIYPPAALIAVGLFFLILGIWGARKWAS